uniref:Dehydrogenase/reductase SDR family member 1 n=1 Tax=Acrobeloides nanus TaxID=290746 RepID=A0A914D3W7_9BILA
MSLRGKIAIVTGASRGIGRGIAVQLGAAGAKVYVTGREPKTSLSNVDRSLPTLETTAQEITERGGEGIIVYVDHSDMEQVKRLFERVSNENEGRLDILVNNAYSAYNAIVDNSDKKFYEADPEVWDEVNNVGLRNHYYCSVYASRLMVARGQGGLIVNVSSIGGLRYFFNVPYGLDRMSADMAQELYESKITVISLWPGAAQTELSTKLVTEDKIKLKESTISKESIKKRFLQGETTEFSGLSVVALAKDPKVHSKTGRTLVTADLACEYGFHDINGRKIQSVRSVGYLLEFGLGYSLGGYLPNWLKLPG